MDDADEQCVPDLGGSNRESSAVEVLSQSMQIAGLKNAKS